MFHVERSTWNIAFLHQYGHTMTLKCTWFFEQGRLGWTETYHYAGNDPDIYTDGFGTITALSTGPAASFMAKRRGLLANTAFILRCRVAKVGSPGVLRVVTVHPNSRVGDWPIASTETWSSLLIRYEAGLTQRRNAYLAGVPGSQIHDPQSLVMSADYTNAVNSFLNLIKSDSYVLYGRPARDPMNEVKITTFDVTPSAREATVQPLIAPPGPQPSHWYVVIRGMKTPRGWNGVHQASGVTGIEMVIGPTAKAMVSDPPYSSLQGATAAVFDPQVNPIDKAGVVRLVERQRGRPFGLQRGRR